MTTEAAFELTRAERAALLRFARATAECRVRREPLPEPPPLTPNLEAPCGAFVTLKAHGDLRGCIGLIAAVEPLWKSVREMAVSAATRDPRFAPVTPAELPAITYEVSVLSPLTRCDDPARIVPGVHGLLIRKGRRQGLLLPQVATEWGWDREAFLAHTCEKAGLPPDAWRDGAEILWFTATVLEEGEMREDAAG